MPPNHNAIVIGAGPAGLATAACLQQAGLTTVVLERTDHVGPAWRRHYDRLQLHTNNRLSHLPGLPFPDGVVRSGSKVGSRYKALIASSNEAYCPTLRGIAPETRIPTEADCVLEIVIDGLDLTAVEDAMRRGLQAASQAGATQISAGNYGGDLGKYKIALHDLLKS